MSYDLYIGQGEYNAETKLYDVQPLTLPEAPSFYNDEMSSHVNHRHPSYSGWSLFCDSTGLGDLFFGSGGLIASHPGYVKLTPKHAYIIHDKLEQYQLSHPNDVPGVCDCSDCNAYRNDIKLPHHPEYNYALARLMWLDWWVKWAIQNCSNPMLANW